MFPIEERSGKGMTYSVFQGEQEVLYLFTNQRTLINLNNPLSTWPTYAEGCNFYCCLGDGT